MKKFIVFFSFSFLMSQVSFTGNTETRIGESKTGFYYNETLVNTNMQYENFVNWLQFEFSDPPELGRSLNGLRKLRMEYNNNNISLKMGDLYEIWNRGIILNSIDDQAIDRDTGLRGLSFDYYSDTFTIQFISGKAKVWQSSQYYFATPFSERVHNYQTNYNLYGVNVNYALDKHQGGVSFLQSKEVHPNSLADTLDVKNQFQEE